MIRCVRINSRKDETPASTRIFLRSSFAQCGRENWTAQATRCNHPAMPGHAQAANARRRVRAGRLHECAPCHRAHLRSDNLREHIQRRQPK